uniref:Uncharacterized protein n=1 Tax=Glossina pallidipes TaxID=7398 RepID=A0A1B0A9N3_GLOPL
MNTVKQCQEPDSFFSPNIRSTHFVKQKKTTEKEIALPCKHHVVPLSFEILKPPLGSLTSLANEPIVRNFTLHYNTFALITANLTLNIRRNFHGYAENANIDDYDYHNVNDVTQSASISDEDIRNSNYSIKDANSVNKHGGNFALFFITGKDTEDFCGAE